MKRTYNTRDANLNETKITRMLSNGPASLELQTIVFDNIKRTPNNNLGAAPIMLLLYKDVLMKARVIITGVGVGGFRGLGVNLSSNAYIQIGERIVLRNYGLTDHFSLGARSSTLVVGHVKTDFFYLGEDAYNKLMSFDYLSGRLLQLEVKGTLAGRGLVDLKLVSIDSSGASETLVERLNIPASGAQLATTQVRGRVRLLPSNGRIPEEATA